MTDNKMQCSGIRLDGEECTQNVYLTSVGGKLWCRHHISRAKYEYMNSCKNILSLHERIMAEKREIERTKNVETCATTTAIPPCAIVQNVSNKLNSNATVSKFLEERKKTQMLVYPTNKRKISEFPNNTRLENQPPYKCMRSK